MAWSAQADRWREAPEKPEFTRKVPKKTEFTRRVRPARRYAD